jgi:hypothetical protein
MGKYLDIVRARRSGAHDINDINDKTTELGRVGRLCRAPSAFADAFAALERRCPDAIPVDRWQWAVEDGRGFLGQWAEQAEALGWSVDDVLGLHPTAPATRYDAMGLVWCLRGSKVVALTANTATIRTESGSLLQFYRKLRMS